MMYNLKHSIKYTSLEVRLMNKYHKGSCKRMFKYYLPKRVYDLIEYSMNHNQFYVDFFTLNPDYKEIWNEFNNNTGRYGRCRLGECGWDDLNQCYCVEVFLPFVLKSIEDLNSPYKYRGLSTYLNDAQKLGYTNVDEITSDWESYHNRIGRMFEEDGLLNKYNKTLI